MTDAMTRDEAEGCWRRIYAHGESMQAELVDLYRRKAWIAYDCKNWTAMMRLKAPGKGSSTYYNMLSDALSATEMLDAGDIVPDLSTILENLPHSHFQAIKALPDPIARKAAVTLAYATAPHVLKDGKPTAMLMEESASVIQEIIDNNGDVALDEGVFAAQAKLTLNHLEHIQKHIDRNSVRVSKNGAGRKTASVSVVNLAHARIVSVFPKANQVTLQFENLDDAEKLQQCYHLKLGNDLIVTMVRFEKKAMRALPA